MRPGLPWSVGSLKEMVLVNSVPSLAATSAPALTVITSAGALTVMALVPALAKVPSSSRSATLMVFGPAAA